eukprot:6716460-Prymnesium_polylepis.1
MRRAIDMHEIYERVTIRKHGSFLPHGAIFKVTQDILSVGDNWAFSLSSLELQNAETKRTASSSGAKNLSLIGLVQQRRSLHIAEGPARLVSSRGNGTTMALSTFRCLEVTKDLRQGDGIDSRRSERVFGEGGKGRLSLSSAGLKVEKLGSEYVPADDTCVKAAVRQLEARSKA